MYLVSILTLSIILLTKNLLIIIIIIIINNNNNNDDNNINNNNNNNNNNNYNNNNNNNNNNNDDNTEKSIILGWRFRLAETSTSFSGSFRLFPQINGRDQGETSIKLSLCPFCIMVAFTFMPIGFLKCVNT